VAAVPGDVSPHPTKKNSMELVVKSRDQTASGEIRVYPVANFALLLKREFISLGTLTVYEYVTRKMTQSFING
jgi:hypothetical protein